MHQPPTVAVHERLPVRAKRRRGGSQGRLPDGFGSRATYALHLYGGSITLAPPADRF